ncbi:MAG TPA: DUF4838 domain-containing protein, partial [Ignavibacteriales bacterium]|nr:DUF4838 domain-containing protein [Ignavibacteriales bacterium]
DATIDEYCRWHKLTDSEDRKTWGLFVHTFQTLLPPEKYFKEHPEYFALRNGLRNPEEPCLSAPDVLRIMADELRARMKANPQAKIWSVSQNDNYSCCKCDMCRSLDSLEGSESASVINFVNKVAREFPDKIISTLAYQYSRKAPKTLKPEKNVNIMLCTIESYRTYPLEADTSPGAFVKDLKDWSKLTNNIILWDYVVQFTNLICPFPNFHVLQPNLQLFAKYGAKMMFQQGAGTVNEGAEFRELRTYLISKLLWNPYINYDSVMNDFLSGYYGAAGKHIKEYIGVMKEGLIKSNGKLWIYSNPVDEMNDYLSPALMTEYNKIFDKAEEAVKNEPEYLERVKIARLPLKYAMLEQAKVLGDGANGTVVKTENGYSANPAIKTLLAEFHQQSKWPGVSYINEKQLSVDEYVRRYDVMLSKTMQNPLGLFKPVTFITEPNFKYQANGYKSLTDGLRGDEDHHFNWLGYEGNDMEVVIDLQAPAPVKKVSADFLQIVLSWIFLPERLEVSLSEDGKNFTEAKIIKNGEPLTREDTFIKNFAAEFNSISARYVKVKAVSIKDCPRWHTGYPFPAWIFTDEIVVE